MIIREDATNGKVEPSLEKQMWFRNTILKFKPENVIPCANFFHVPVFKVIFFKLMLLMSVSLSTLIKSEYLKKMIKLGNLHLLGVQWLFNQSSNRISLGLWNSAQTLFAMNSEKQKQLSLAPGLVLALLWRGLSSLVSVYLSTILWLTMSLNTMML